MAIAHSEAAKKAATDVVVDLVDRGAGAGYFTICDASLANTCSIAVAAKYAVAGSLGTSLTVAAEAAGIMPPHECLDCAAGMAIGET
jgi:hypothetical protein